MKLRSLKVSGLYSYGNETEVTIPDICIITGANNAGKSNLFRVVDLVISSLTDSTRRLGADESFDNNGSPWVELRLTLTPQETDQIINYLSFYKTESSDQPTYIPLDKELLRNTLDEIRIKINWKMRGPRYKKEVGNIEFLFEKIGVTLFANGIHDSLWINTKESVSNAQQLFRKWLICRPSERQKTTEELCGAFEAGESKSMVVSEIPSYYSPSEHGALQILREIITYTNGVSEIYFLELIGTIIQKSVYHASGERMFQPGGLDYTQKLKSDGSNLTQFLFSLKTSESLEERDRYDAIRRKFKDMMTNDGLCFDVIIEEVEERDASSDKKSTGLPRYNSRIVIIDTRQKKQFRLDQAGSGIGEIIFLLTLGYGVENSVILLDEPAINLSHPQIGKIMRVLLGLDGKDSSANIEQKSNQFLIITHSAELARVLLFEKGIEFLHVIKTDGKSAIHHLDDKTKEWFQKDSTRLKHQIDTRMFFGKKIIFTEGESDTTFLTEVASNLMRDDELLDIDARNVIIVNVDGKCNFPKYKRLADSLKIPYVILADNDVLERSSNDMKEIFESYSFVTATGIEGNNNSVFVIKNGDLEALMKELDQYLYLEIENRLKKESESEKRIPKSIKASEYVKELVKENPKALCPIKKLLRKMLS